MKSASTRKGKAPLVIYILGFRLYVGDGEHSPNRGTPKVCCLSRTNRHLLLLLPATGGTTAPRGAVPSRYPSIIPLFLLFFLSTLQGHRRMPVRALPSGQVPRFRSPQFHPRGRRTVNIDIPATHRPFIHSFFLAFTLSFVRAPRRAL